MKLLPGQARAAQFAALGFPLTQLIYLQFPTTTVGMKSREKTITLLNVGDETMTVTIPKTTASGDYQITVGGGTHMILPGGTMTVRVTFTPSQAGLLLDSIPIKTNDPFNPTVNFGLAGCGQGGGSGA